MIKSEKRVRFGLSAERILSKYLQDPKILKTLKYLKIKYGLTRDQIIRLFRSKM